MQRLTAIKEDGTRQNIWINGDHNGTIDINGEDPDVRIGVALEYYPVAYHVTYPQGTRFEIE